MARKARLRRGSVKTPLFQHRKKASKAQHHNCPILLSCTFLMGAALRATEDEPHLQHKDADFSSIFNAAYPLSHTSLFPSHFFSIHFTITERHFCSPTQKPGDVIKHDDSAVTESRKRQLDEMCYNHGNPAQSHSV